VCTVRTSVSGFDVPKERQARLFITRISSDNTGRFKNAPLLRSEEHDVINMQYEAN
jgi:hypothetical protein